MTCASPNPNAAVLAGLLLLALLPSPVAGQGAGWTVIDTAVHCRDDVMRVEQNLRVAAGGSLLLEGCSLVVASQPYQDEWIGAISEGLDVRVEAGGRLELRSMPGRAATMAPADAAYGYTVTVEGVFVAQGAPGQPVEIRGLEGFMAESFLGGGLLVTQAGRAYLNNTAVSDIKGPAVFAHDGGAAFLRGVTVRQASGAFAALNATLSVTDADVNTGIEAIRVSQSRLALDNVTARTDRVALHATRSTVTARGVDLSARNAVVLVESHAAFEACTLTHAGFGLAHQPAPVPGAPGHVEVKACDVRPRPGAQGAVGLFAEHAHLQVTDSRVAGHDLGGVSAKNAGVRVERTVFTGSGATDVYASNAPSLVLDGNTHSATATKPVRTMYQVQAVVLDPAGAPVEGAVVRVGDATGATAADGTATLLWEPAFVAGAEAVAQVEATWQERTLGRAVTPLDRAPVFDFGASGQPAPAPELALVLVLLAFCARAVRPAACA